MTSINFEKVATLHQTTYASPKWSFNKYLTPIFGGSHSQCDSKQFSAINLNAQLLKNSGINLTSIFIFSVVKLLLNAGPADQQYVKLTTQYYKICKMRNNVFCISYQACTNIYCTLFIVKLAILSGGAVKFTKQRMQAPSNENFRNFCPRCSRLQT